MKVTTSNYKPNLQWKKKHVSLPVHMCKLIFMIVNSFASDSLPFKYIDNRFLRGLYSVLKAVECEAENRSSF